MVFAWVMIIGSTSLLALGGVEDLDRGHRLFLEKGIQLHGLVYDIVWDTTCKNLFDEAGFTTVHFGQGVYVDGSSVPNTYQWAQWSFDPNGYHPYTSMLATASHSDEQDITNPHWLTFYADWHAQMRTNYPHVISAVHQGGNPGITALQNYANVVQPDMVMFDHYVFDSGGTEGGSPTTLYNTMGTYRAVGLGGHDGTGTIPIPYSMWYQSYRPFGYVLSESELALQYYAAWAYGYKMLSAFTFSELDNLTDVTGSVFFDGPPTYENRTALYFAVQKLNNQTHNLGPALLRLLSTDIRFVRGQHKEGPSVPLDNNLPNYAQDWDSQADPYITNISATNLGGKNAGLRGDVLVGYYNVLDEEFDGPSEDEIYFMITNGLTDSDGSSLDTEQMIRLDFDFSSSGISQLQRLDRSSGEVMHVPLEHDGSSQYHLNWNLLGGEGDLFKFDTGAPFVGALLSGDVNGDGFVGGDDLTIILEYWGQSVTGREQGDLNGDFFVGGDDYSKVLSHWGEGTPSGLVAIVGTPEPATLALLLLGGLALLRHRSPEPSRRA